MRWESPPSLCGLGVAHWSFRETPLSHLGLGDSVEGQVFHFWWALPGLWREKATE